MEFNGAYDSSSAMERASTMFERYGYNVPTLVWWNLASRNGTNPCRMDANGNVLVSGFSPSVMKSALNGKGLTPYDIMISTVMIDRYELL